MGVGNQKAEVKINETSRCLGNEGHARGSTNRSGVDLEGLCFWGKAGLHTYDSAMGLNDLMVACFVLYRGH